MTRWIELTSIFVLSLFLMGHHPAYPAPLDVIPFDDGPVDWTLVTTSGFITSDDPAHLICKEAFGVTGLVYEAVLGPRHFALATDSGVVISRDGCDIAHEHDVDGRVLDLDGQGSTLAVVVENETGDHLYISRDGGETLEILITLPPETNATTVGVIDETQVVLAAYDAANNPRGDARLFVVHVENGQTETISSEANLRFPFIFATGHGQVAWAARRGFDPVLAWGPPHDPERLVVDLPNWPVYASFDEEGDDIWVVGLDYERSFDAVGIARATVDGLVEDPRFEEMATLCAVSDGGGLWVCTDGFAEEYEIWRVDGDDEPLPFYRLAYLQGPRKDCPRNSAVATICPDAWELISPEIARQGFGGDEPGDDSALPDWIADSMNPDTDDRESSGQSSGNGACQISDGPAGLAHFLALAMVAFLFLRRVTLRQRDRRMPGR